MSKRVGCLGKVFLVMDVRSHRLERAVCGLEDGRQRRDEMPVCSPSHEAEQKAMYETYLINEIDKE